MATREIPVTVTCRLGAESAFWRPDPFPGSPAARERGCQCPADQPWPGALAFELHCPIPAHQLVKAEGESDV